LRLTLTAGVITALGIITGPLQARALGPSGRGALAAIAVVGAWLPVIAGLGFETFIARRAAREFELPEVFGTLGLASLLVGVLIAPLGFPISHLLAHGRHTVQVFILVQFLVLPIGLMGQLSYYCLVGLERWTALIVVRLLPIVIPAIAIIALFVRGGMTVALVAVVTIASSVAAIVPMIPGLRRMGRPRVHLGLLREAVPFSLRAWVGTIAGLTNGRLDQLLMVSFVSSRQLGLYAVAVTVASPAAQIATSVASPLLTRVAAGDRYLVSRALRTTLALVALVDAVGMLLTWWLLPVIFGGAFSGAVPMAAILLVAALPLCATTVLSVVMVADGRPSIPAIAELMTLGITVPGLVILLPLLGGIGAALVSLGAYSANSAFQLRAARMHFGDPLSAFIVPRRTDATWAYHRLREVLGRNRGGSARHEL
jgi:O-antigen/teichoic acid export membrane protein